MIRKSGELVEAVSFLSAAQFHPFTSAKAVVERLSYKVKTCMYICRRKIIFFFTRARAPRMTGTYTLDPGRADDDG